MAKLDSTQCIGFEWPSKTTNYMAVINRHQRNLDTLQKVSDNLPDGQIVGTLYSQHVADGAAYYLVVNDSPLTLQHVPYCDAYMLRPAEIRGITKKDIKDYRKYRGSIRSIFG